MKKTAKAINKVSSVLGLFFVGLGVLLFVIQQMSPDNPENKPAEGANRENPKASNDKPLTTPSPEVINYNAHFAIFTNGTFRIFTSAMYHNKNTDLYISADNPNTIQVRKKNLTWQDFFNTLPMKLDPNCLTTGTGQIFCSKDQNVLRFFINGKEDPDALSKSINPKDQLLVTYGEENEQTIASQLAKLQSLTSGF